MGNHMVEGVRKTQIFRDCDCALRIRLYALIRTGLNPYILMTWGWDWNPKILFDREVFGFLGVTAAIKTFNGPEEAF